MLKTDIPCVRYDLKIAQHTFEKQSYLHLIILKNKKHLK